MLLPGVVRAEKDAGQIGDDVYDESDDAGKDAPRATQSRCVENLHCVYPSLSLGLICCSSPQLGARLNDYLGCVGGQEGCAAPNQGQVSVPVKLSKRALCGSKRSRRPVL